LKKSAVQLIISSLAYLFFWNPLAFMWISTRQHFYLWDEPMHLEHDFLFPCSAARKVVCIWIPKYSVNRLSVAQSQSLGLARKSSLEGCSGVLQLTVPTLEYY